MIAKTGGIMDTMESPEVIGVAGLQGGVAGGVTASAPMPTDVVSLPGDRSAQSVGRHRIPAQGDPASWH